jgi:SNF2 family DNA or RNA helicase
VVDLQSLDDDRLQDTLSVVWELEVGHSVSPAQGLPDIIRPEAFDDPTALAGFIDALRWGAVTSADPNRYQAPFWSGVNLEAYQLEPLRRALGSTRANLLLADDVGLGKTIEAGLILRELKVRGLAKRILVVAPAGLTSQWVSEMKTHFSEDFRLVQPGNFPAWRQLAGVDEKENLWRLHDQVVCPLDSIKPMGTRRGWSREQVARYNRERFEDLVSAGWDLVIIDEAHRLGGSSEQVARYRLGEALAQASPYLLLPRGQSAPGLRRLVWRGSRRVSRRRC